MNGTARLNGSSAPPNHNYSLLPTAFSLGGRRLTFIALESPSLFSLDGQLGIYFIYQGALQSTPRASNVSGVHLEEG